MQAMSTLRLVPMVAIAETSSHRSPGSRAETVAPLIPHATRLRHRGAPHPPPVVAPGEWAVAMPQGVKLYKHPKVTGPRYPFQQVAKNGKNEALLSEFDEKSTPTARLFYVM